MDFKRFLDIIWPYETNRIIFGFNSVKPLDSLARNSLQPEIALKNGWLDPELKTTHTTSTSMLKMPSPYLQPQEIDGLMRTIPLYVYFPHNFWNDIEKAEKFALYKTYDGDYFTMEELTKKIKKQQI